MTREEFFVLAVRDLVADGVPDDLIDLHKGRDGTWTILVAGQPRARIAPLPADGRVALTVFATQTKGAT